MYRFVITFNQAELGKVLFVRFKTYSQVAKANHQTDAKAVNSKYKNLSNLLGLWLSDIQ